MADKNYGIMFVKNYLGVLWPRERLTVGWDILPNEKSMESFFIIYQYSDDISVPEFRGLQLIFELILHDEHPIKPPSIKFHTPTGRVKPGERICIKGLTAYHPEEWVGKTPPTISSIIDRMLCIFIDLEAITAEAVGFIASTPKQYAAFSAASAEWNAKHFPDLVASWMLKRAEMTRLAAAPAAPVAPVAPVVLPTSIDEDFVYSSDDE